MSWNIELIGTRAAVASQLVQFTAFPMATGVAKYVSFAADPNPWARVKTHGIDSNIHALQVEFFTPVPEAPTPVESVPQPVTEAPPPVASGQ